MRDIPHFDGVRLADFGPTHQGERSPTLPGETPDSPADAAPPLLADASQPTPTRRQPFAVDRAVRTPHVQRTACRRLPQRSAASSGARGCTWPGGPPTRTAHRTALCCHGTARDGAGAPLHRGPGPGRIPARMAKPCGRNRREVPHGLRALPGPVHLRFRGTIAEHPALRTPRDVLP